MLVACATDKQGKKSFYIINNTFFIVISNTFDSKQNISFKTSSLLIELIKTCIIGAHTKLVLKGKKKKSKLKCTPQN